MSQLDDYESSRAQTSKQKQRANQNYQRTLGNI